MLFESEMNSSNLSPSSSSGSGEEHSSREARVGFRRFNRFNNDFSACVDDFFDIILPDGKRIESLSAITGFLIDLVGVSFKLPSWQSPSISLSTSSSSSEKS